MSTKTVGVALLALSLIGLSSCKHLGPRSIVADRLPYNDAVSSSWKEQTLLNIVKMRYGDTPFFIDIPQITSGYTHQTQGTINGGIFPPVNPLASFAQELGLTLNLQGVYQDRPTISYTPQTDSQFVRNLTNPINPGSILFLLQSGYPADVIFNLTVDSINGIKNRTVMGAQVRDADPEFAHIVQVLRKAQLNGHVGIRVHHDKDKPDSVVMFFQDKDIDPELAGELAGIRRILRLSPEAREFRIVFGPTASAPTEIAILSRSAYRILLELASFVEVPLEHLASGIAPPIGQQPSCEQPLRVLSGCKKPKDAFIAVRYEERWFWIEKCDMYSKRTLNYLLILLALSDTGTKESMPLITIQAN